MNCKQLEVIIGLFGPKIALSKELSIQLLAENVFLTIQSSQPGSGHES